MTHRYCGCPKCGADVSDSYQPDDWSVGIQAGWYCEACDLAFGDDFCESPMEGDVPLMTSKEAIGDKPLGTPISELSGRPGHQGYEEFVRIAKSWGYE